MKSFSLTQEAAPTSSAVNLKLELCLIRCILRARYGLDFAVISFTAPMNSMDTEPDPECSWKCHSNFLASCSKKVKLYLHLVGGCC